MKHDSFFLTIFVSINALVLSCLEYSMELGIEAKIIQFQPYEPKAFTPHSLFN